MSMTYTVVGAIKSRTIRVLWCLEELGQPYTRIDAAPRSPEAHAHNPDGKVPALLDGPDAITDSVAIMTYLADKHGQLTHPAGTLARARQDAVTHFLLDEFDALLWTAARHSFALPEEHRVPEIKDSLKWDFTRACTRLNTRLTGPYLAGEFITIPDLIATHCLGWAINAHFPLKDEKLRSWIDTQRARPAYQRAIAA
jgi:glutathione S-transferase